MIPRIAITAAFVLVAACGGNQPATGGAGGAPQGGANGIGGSAAGNSSAGQQSAGAGAGGTSAGSAGAGAAGGGMGGAAGVAGTSGAGGGGGALTLVMPIERGDVDVLEFGPLSFTVAPAIGARITSLKLDGDELLTGPTENDRFYGSTLWTSPADDWVVGPFDPPAVVDRNPYTTTVADGVITATSPSSTANNKTFTVTKVFKADLAKQAIVIDYQLKNTGASTFKLSHWEVTRVFPDGLSFFATGTSQKIDFLPQDMTLASMGGHTWYDNETHTAQGGESKAGAETPGGFIAHVVPNAKGPILFVKAFEDVAANSAPTGHYEVELFCNDAHTYVELEDHSSFDDIAPGATYTQTVTWYLRRLPVGTPVTVGSAELIGAVNTLLGK
jgi:hypothetical protein